MDLYFAVSGEPIAEKDSYWLTSSCADDWPRPWRRFSLRRSDFLLESHGPSNVCLPRKYIDTAAMWSIIRRLHYLSIRACKSEQYAIEYVKVFVYSSSIVTWITCCSAVVSKGATLIDRALSLIEIGSVASVGRGSSAVAVSIVPDSDRSWFANRRTTSCDNGIAMNDDGAIGASPVRVCRAAAPGHPRPRLSKTFHTVWPEQN